MQTYLWILFEFQVWCKLYYPDRQPILVEVIYITIYIICTCTKSTLFIYFYQGLQSVNVNVLKGTVVRENFLKQI
jgi:hypothetical protein